ncbi:outer membrane receptor protein involved in Fe transport [Algoriphagus sp. 4150]|uniref:outer membrane beta-barrel family protein n=1 Tax=Algoriphagus sp. 4150 TaxID=2817756 RepID=UPI00285AB7DC|nr:outer membrane beta-barrel family protein [Algoriphagus sp. 4150]MDR7128005.1 outer membrane receptor protein involved in Fe transport [Algoriphagus sp. 4150]
MKITVSFPFIFFFLAFPMLVFAQTYQVSGTLKDEQNKEVLAFVQVALFAEGDETNPVVFSDSDEEGNFSLEAPQGTYIFKAFFLGFQDQIIQDVKVSGNVELGDILMQSESKNLEEVIVRTSRMPVRTGLEGIVITPENNIANTGGTLLDILRNTPSISVNVDGTIALRGSTGTNILINGRNSSLTQNLDQLPASTIEEVRVINNPNARFDAEAESGVIDIILKKGQDLGTHGGVEGTYGTRNRSNVGARLNHRGANFNVFGGYNYRDWKDVGTQRSNRVIFEEKETLTQNTDNTGRDKGHNMNYGADYYFGNNILSYEGIYQYGQNSQTNTLYAVLHRMSEAGEEDEFDYVRRNKEDNTNEVIDNALIYEHNFKDKGHLLRFTASNSYQNQYKTQRIEIFGNALNPSPENLTGQERAYTDEVRNISVFQFDYIKPFGNGKFETGLKSNIRKFDNDYIYLRKDESSQEFIEDPTISNRFLYKDQIHAGYVVLSAKRPKFEYGLGLRGEFTQVDTYLENTDEENRQDYFNLFPSLQTMYNLNEKHSLKFTYSRRIDRPKAWSLNPFPDITDSLNIQRGNPKLQPEMINSFEFGHLANYEKSSLSTNLFYRKVNGQLDFITFLKDGISYTQPENLLSSSSYGLEFIGTSEVNDWYAVNGGVTVFRIAVDGSNISEEFTNSGFSWSAKLTQDFKLIWGLNFQLVANYDSPEIEAQGKDLAQYYMDASLQRSFFGDKGNLSLSLRDVFDTMRFAGNALTNSFSQDFYVKRETRILLTTARFNF